MDILLWIVFGLVVGIVAKFIMPGPDPGGIILTVVLGIVGAMFGGWLGRAMGLYREGEAAGFIMAIVGAIIILALYRLVARTPSFGLTVAIAGTRDRWGLGSRAVLTRRFSSRCWAQETYGS